MAKLYDRRDVDFLLNEVLEIDGLTRFPRFQEHSEEIFAMILDAADKLAHEEIAQTNVDGDRIGARYEDGKVFVPESFHRIWKAYIEGGWMTLMEDEELGGQQLPVTLGITVEAIFDAANHSFVMLPGLTHGAARMIEAFGTEEQKAKYLGKMLSGQWAGTMCLTEPQAGSDVGALTTVAKPNGDGTYSIKGTKIFISWGEHDVTENIIHPVLARIEGDPPGTKGISLFLVPKIRINPDGSLGGPNDVYCAGIEHKMGIHGSPTCTLVFGENDQCVGELLGEPRKGMKIMFQMMNSARIGVAVQGLALAEAAYLYALEYARERRQGSSIKEWKNPEAPRVPIIQHPDVRRMLLDMKAKVEAMRAIITYTAFQLDIAMAAEGTEAETAQAIAEIMTPIAKAWCTDVGFRVNETAIQVLGGHGYLKDHPLEQYLRDAKIGSIYEGTNGIQALDLLGRKIPMKGGQYFMTFLAAIDETVAAAKSIESLAKAAEFVERARTKVAETAMNFMMAFQGGDLSKPLLNAKPFLDSVGDLVAAWLLLQQGVVAAEKLPAAEGVQAQFYQNKIATVDYFARRTLPETLARFDVLQSDERAALDLVFPDEEAPLGV